VLRQTQLHNADDYSKQHKLLDYQAGYKQIHSSAKTKLFVATNKGKITLKSKL